MDDENPEGERGDAGGAEQPDERRRFRREGAVPLPPDQYQEQSGEKERGRQDVRNRRVPRVARHKRENADTEAFS